MHACTAALNHPWIFGKVYDFQIFFNLGIIGVPKHQRAKIDKSGPLRALLTSSLCLFAFAFIHEWICEMMGCLLNGELQVRRLVLHLGAIKVAAACALSSSALSTPELRPARSVGRVHLASIVMLKFVSCIKTWWRL